MTKFREAWNYLFDKHEVSLITVWDGERPRVTYSPGCSKTEMDITHTPLLEKVWTDHRDLFVRFSDACRNLGFVAAAAMGADFIFTADDDVAPVSFCDCPSGYWKDNWDDPIKAHLNALNKKVSTSWMSTAHDTELHLRGEPYSTREESPVMLSHGVWVGVPDFDGETQLRLENQTPSSETNWFSTQTGVPYTLPYYIGPIPRGVLSALCGMSLMVRKEALPYLYFAPMGPDSGVTDGCSTCTGPGRILDSGNEWKGHPDCKRCRGTGRISILHRFSDIWMSVFLKREFDSRGWAVLTGTSTILHTRASDAKKNFEQEKLGREWNERIALWSLLNELPEYPKGTDISEQEWNYFRSYAEKRRKYAELIQSVQGRESGGGENTAH